MTCSGLTMCFCRSENHHKQWWKVSWAKFMPQCVAERLNEKHLNLRACTIFYEGLCREPRFISAVDKLQDKEVQICSWQLLMCSIVWVLVAMCPGVIVFRCHMGGIKRIENSKASRRCTTTVLKTWRSNLLFVWWLHQLLLCLNQVRFISHLFSYHPC